MRLKNFTFLFTFIFLASTTSAMSAGFRLVEQDNAGQGRAHAMVASVADAAAVYYNPAAMFEVGKYASKVGVQFVDPKVEYDGQGTSMETSNETFAVPHLYVVHQYEGKGLAVGFGVFTNFGLGTTWSNDSPFRYVATDTELRTNTLNLNVAKKFGDKFSFAAGVDYMSSDVRFDSMFPFKFFVPGSADGYTVLKGTGDGWGYNLAMLFKPTDQIKIGVSYRSEIKTELTGDMEVLNFPSALQPLLALKGITGDDYKTSHSANINYPEILVVGISFQPNNKLTLECDIDYTGWSSYDELKIETSDSVVTPSGATLVPASTVSKKDWNDVTAFRFGASYKATEKLALRTGYYFDPTPIPEGTLDPRLPGNDRNMVALGAGYKAMDNFTIDVAYSYIWTDTRSVNNSVGAGVMSSVNGDYKTTTHIFGVSVGYAM